jgi:hypothetical protein
MCGSGIRHLCRQSTPHVCHMLGGQDLRSSCGLLVRRSAGWLLGLLMVSDLGRCRLTRWSTWVNLTRSMHPADRWHALDALDTAAAGVVTCTHLPPCIVCGGCLSRLPSRYRILCTGGGLHAPVFWVTALCGVLT